MAKGDGSLPRAGLLAARSSLPAVCHLTCQPVHSPLPTPPRHVTSLPVPPCPCLALPAPPVSSFQNHFHLHRASLAFMNLSFPSTSLAIRTLGDCSPPTDHNATHVEHRGMPAMQPVRRCLVFSPGGKFFPAFFHHGADSCALNFLSDPSFTIQVFSMAWFQDQAAKWCALQSNQRVQQINL